MNINYNQLPQWTIACYSLETASDLRRLLKKFTRGTYELYIIRRGRKITVKYGMTADQNQGDRMYRQIWRFPGWPTEPSELAAGNDLDDTVQRLLALYPDLTRRDLYVHIYDMSELRPLNSLRPEHEPYTLEGQLILEHYERTGQVPIGNKLEQRRVAKGQNPRLVKTVTPDTLIDRLFDLG